MNLKNMSFKVKTPDYFSDSLSIYNNVVYLFYNMLCLYRVFFSWRHIFRVRDKTKAELFDYIDVFYNRARRHQHLGN